MKSTTTGAKSATADTKTAETPAEATGEQSMQVDMPLAAWHAAEDLAQARTLDSLERLLAAFAVDLAEAARWPETRAAQAAWEWLEARYAPADWLKSRRRERQREGV